MMIMMTRTIIMITIMIIVIAAIIYQKNIWFVLHLSRPNNSATVQPFSWHIVAFLLCLASWLKSKGTKSCKKCSVTDKVSSCI